MVVKGNVTLFQGTSKFSNLHKRDRKMLLLLLLQLPYLANLNSSVKKKESLIKFGKYTYVQDALLKDLVQCLILIKFSKGHAELFSTFIFHNGI